MENDAKRVLVVDSCTFSREGIVSFLNAQSDLRVCADTGNVPSARSACIQHSPDLLLINSELRHDDPIQLLRDLPSLSPSTLAVVLAGQENPELLECAMRLGVRTFLSKFDEPLEILAGLRAALSGKHFASREIASMVVRLITSSRLRGATDGVRKLSAREFEVFRLIAKNRSVKIIASELGISVRTVETHEARMKDKLRLKSCAELRSFAVNWRSQTH